jgi:hypothetical protein
MRALVMLASTITIVLMALVLTRAFLQEARADDDDGAARVDRASQVPPARPRVDPAARSRSDLSALPDLPERDRRVARPTKRNVTS